MPSRRICVGIISRPFGVRGQVRVRPYTTSPTVFLRFSELFLFDGTRLVLKHPKVNEKSEVITWIEGYNGRTAVEVLHLKRLYVDREALPPLNENEFYLEDLSGLAVFNQDDK
ncbi:MAG: 16S rRNA processing protein RimM, partial [Alphaproteobacteria bacterium]|nr:16S rRNA processing protein RimM [Alphaproteobacteria bacterium]